MISDYENKFFWGLAVCMQQGRLQEGKLVSTGRNVTVAVTLAQCTPPAPAHVHPVTALIQVSQLGQPRLTYPGI
jgi:hypothetical protein